MDIELKKRYIAALRSNDYKQCFNIVRKKNKGGPDSFCAIGVLLDVLAPNLWEWVTNSTFGSPRYVHDRNSTLFNDLIPINERFKIVEMNDQEKKTFAQIADEVENF